MVEKPQIYGKVDFFLETIMKITLPLAVVGAACLHMAVASIPTAHAAEAAPQCAHSYSQGTCELMEANTQMHQHMNIEWTGDVDTDFMRGMIPHHQGAVDMAKIVLKHGKDPQVRALAQKVITDQNAEIEQMNAWLRAHPQKSAAAQPEHHH